VSTALVVGASGGIGGAVFEQLRTSGRHEQVVGWSRRAIDEFTHVDLTDETSIQAGAEALADAPPLRFVFVATGLLHADGLRPERNLRELDAAALNRLFQVNAVGPALLAKHLLPLLPREGRSVFAALSARVGSIGDNRLGGWHAYRASKAALNMLLRNAAVELARTHREAVVALLHPGTVDTALSAPFQRNVGEGRLFDPAFSAERLLAVLDGLTPADTGGFWAWDGQPVPW
jgi:NAD(P)-dependent dehydrogenase (short-subunit alcohol dehydrogenase family)